MEKQLCVSTACTEGHQSPRAAPSLIGWTGQEGRERAWVKHLCAPGAVLGAAGLFPFDLTSTPSAWSRSQRKGRSGELVPSVQSPAAARW